MSASHREQFLKALQAMQQGRIQVAIDLLEPLLAANPREVNALRLRAQCDLALNQFSRARSKLEQVVSLAADYAEGWSDLARAHQQLGSDADAERCLRRALSINPKLGSAAKTLQSLLRARGEESEAQQLAEQLPSRSRRAAQLREIRPLLAANASPDDQRRGEQLALAAMEHDPLNPALAQLLFNRAIATNRAHWAEQIAGRFTVALPENKRWWLHLATALSRQDLLEPAAQACRRALEIEPDWREALMLLGQLASKDNDFATALDYFDRVIDHSPDFVAALSQRATALKTLGRSSEAINAYQRCLELDPSCGEAAWSLANLKTYRFNAAEQEAIQAQLAKQDLPAQERVYFGYALAKAHEHQQQWQQAFASYASANAVKRDLVRWDSSRFSAQIDAIIDTFTPQLLASLVGAGVDDSSPIFILGLPRSGSTLQEQILASHSAVEGTRELPYIPWLASGLARPPKPLASQPYPVAMVELSAEQLATIGKRYLEQAARHRSTGKPHFIDKLPNNFIYLGLILVSLPAAKIINTRRQPMDNCFGCFKQLWAEGQNFSYSLEDLGHYYRDYHRLMAHWHQCFPGRILDVQYEDVVSDINRHVERLLDFCELPFEQQCIDFHQTDRAVNTASSEQVRQPLYSSAVAYWRNFESYLEPLRETLGDLAEQ